jgi:hypothetical protein
MSGSAGGNRISRAAVEKTVQDYIDKVLSKFPGFKDAKATGSYNTGTKQDFGDIDLIVHLDSKDKKLVKQDLAKYFASLPDSVIVPFKSDKYKGKKSLSSGELVTVLYPISGVPDEFVQIDNIVSISEEESTFKNTFLDYPAEIQGLLLGLAKVICLEEDPKKIFARLGITNVPELEANQEYEFNLSSAGLTLRIVTLDNFKELDRTEVWKSSNWSIVKKLFDNYNIDGDFKTLLQDLKSKLKNERSKNRIKGIFKSMVSIKSGEVDTPKGDNKQAALDAVSSLLENKLFKGLVKELILPLIEADSKKTVAIYGGGFKPPHKGHFEVVEKALEQFPQIDEFIIYVGSGTRDGITQAESLLTWDIYKKYLPLKVKVEPAKSPIRAIYEYIENHQDEDVIWVIGARDGKDDDFVDLASKTKGIGKYENVELAPIITQSDTSGTDARQALKKGQEAFLPFIPEKVKEKTEIFNTLSTVIQEIVTATEVICDNCGWKWKIADGGKDLYICHKCGYDNNPALNKSLKEGIISLSDEEETKLRNLIPIFIQALKEKDFKVGLTNPIKYKMASGEEAEFVPYIYDDGDTRSAAKFLTQDNTNFKDNFIGINGNYWFPAFEGTLESIWKTLTGDNPKEALLSSLRHELIHAKDPAVNHKPLKTKYDPSKPELYYGTWEEFPAQTGEFLEAIKFNSYEYINNNKDNLKQAVFELNSYYQDILDFYSGKNKMFNKSTMDWLSKGEKGNDIQKFIRKIADWGGWFLGINTNPGWDSRSTLTNFHSNIEQIRKYNPEGYKEFQKDLYKTIQNTIDYINTKLPKDSPLLKAGGQGKLKEGKENNDYKKYIPELTKYMVNQGMNIKPLPVVKFINNDKANAENVFGKTAFYSPEEKSITLFTMNRHPKDVLRSFAHEMIHHEQNLDSRLNNIGTTNTNEGGDLPEIEREAYEKGNMMFRNWEDSIKNK